MKEKNFVEVDTVEDANVVNLDVWRFIGIKADRYCFVKRVNVKK